MGVVHRQDVGESLDGKLVADDVTEEQREPGGDPSRFCAAVVFAASSLPATTVE
jgi:hypothetical protein